MHRQTYAQRLHIINSFDALLYQLHVLSFFLSPSLWSLSCRVLSQIQCTKPRTFDPNRSLRFWYVIIILFNATSLWRHALEGAAVGKAVVLDFVGMAYVPSKLQLLFLDVLILFLQLLVATISYETSLSNTSDESAFDPLLPIPPPAATPPTYYSSSPTISALSPTTVLNALPSKTPPPESAPPYIIDVRLAPILVRLRNPAPAAIPDPSLPLPNTTSRGPWSGGVPNLRTLLRTRVQTRRSQMRGTANAPGSQGNVSDEEVIHVPGSLDSEEP